MNVKGIVPPSGDIKCEDSTLGDFLLLDSEQSIIGVISSLIEKKLEGVFKTSNTENPLDEVHEVNSTKNKTTPKKKRALRFNNGKIDPTYCIPALIYAISAVFMKSSEKFGGKYPDGNYLTGMPAEDWKASKLRHTLALIDGEKLDPDTKLPHLWHDLASGMIGLISDLEGWEDKFEENPTLSVQKLKAKYGEQLNSIFEQGKKLGEEKA